MKKVFSLLVAVIVIVGTVGIVSVNAEGDILFSVSSADAEPGDTVELTVNVSNNPGICGMVLSVDYDSSKLEWTNVTKGSMDGVWDVAVGTTIDFGAAENATGDAVVATLTFKVKDGASGFANVSVAPDKLFAFDKEYDEQSVGFSISSGGVNILEEQNPEPEPEPTPEPGPNGEVPPTSNVTGWKKISGKWYFYNPSGILQVGWVSDAGKWYYMDDTGAMQRGWQLINGRWYYLGWAYDLDSGAMRTGWVYDGSNWYYMNSSGAMQTGWIKDGNTWYFLKSSGAMAAKEYISGYWLNANGSWTYPYRASWHRSGSRWWYGDTSGWYAANKSYKIDGIVYDFDSAGWMK